MKRAGSLFAVLLSLACTTSPRARAPITAGGEVHDVGEGSVVVLTRPSAEGVLVQLWIDAGSLDGEGAPELASLAAWIAEARGGSSVHARVVPDGTVFTARAATLSEALAPLALALGTRDPSDAELMRARDVLRTRRRGRARDPLAAIEARAAALLLGPIDPLGVASDREVELTAVHAFLGAHYGPSRARWVVVGDLDVGAVRSAVLEQTATLPAAEHDAGLRQLVEGPRSLAVEDAAGWSFAVLGAPSSIGGPTGLASARADRFAHFPTPCGELGIVSAEGALDGSTLRALQFALSAGVPRLAGDSDADVDAERAGLRFVARAERCASSTTSAVAWVLSAPDHAERRREELDAVLGDDRTLAVHHEDVDGHTALVSITLAGGSLEDPASMHGRAAILARALAMRCGVTAFVEPERVRLEAALDGSSAEALDASLARALSCLLVEPMPPAFLEAARAGALDALDADARFVAAAARAIAPSTPGLVAPNGEAAGLVGASELPSALERLRATARLRVAVIAPHAPSASIGRALGALSAGELTPPTLGPAGPREVFVPSIEATLPEVIVTLRLDSAGRSADARTVAASLSAELDATALSVQRYASGDAGGVSWVAIAVTGPDDVIDDLDALLPAAVARCDAGLDAALRAASAARATERAARSTRASEVARRALAPDPVEPDPLASRTLLHAPPHRVIVRPSTPPLRRR